MTQIEPQATPPEIWGWLGGGRSGMERSAYVLHRITGLGILLYFLLHVIITSLRAVRLYLWEEPHIFDGPIFKFGEFLVFAAFAYHAFNGIRLLLVEWGVPVGKPMDEGCKSSGAPATVRPLLFLIMLLAFMFFMAGGYRFVMASD